MVASLSELALLRRSHRPLPTVSHPTITTIVMSEMSPSRQVGNASAIFQIEEKKTPNAPVALAAAKAPESLGAVARGSFVRTMPSTSRTRPDRHHGEAT